MSNRKQRHNSSIRKRKTKYSKANKTKKVKKNNKRKYKPSKSSDRQRGGDDDSQLINNIFKNNKKETPAPAPQPVQPPVTTNGNTNITITTGDPNNNGNGTSINIIQNSPPNENQNMSKVNNVVLSSDLMKITYRHAQAQNNENGEDKFTSLSDLPSEISLSDISLYQMHNLPYIKLDSSIMDQINGDGQYVLIMYDDNSVISPEEKANNPKQAFYLHTVILYNKDFPHGKVQVRYMGPNPPENSNIHNYIFELYDMKDKNGNVRLINDIKLSKIDIPKENNDNDSIESSNLTPTENQNLGNVNQLGGGKNKRVIHSKKHNNIDYIKVLVGLSSEDKPIATNKFTVNSGVEEEEAEINNLNINNTPSIPNNAPNVAVANEQDIYNQEQSQLSPETEGTSFGSTNNETTKTVTLTDGSSTTGETTSGTTEETSSGETTSNTSSGNTEDNNENLDEEYENDENLNEEENDEEKELQREAGEV